VTFGHLHAVMQTSKTRICNAKMSISALKEAENEFRVERERLEQVLREFGVCPDALSQSGTISLRTLSTVGNKLGLNEMRNGTFYSALYQLYDDTDAIREKLIENQRQQSVMSAKISRVQAQRQAIRTQLEEFTLHQQPRNARAEEQIAEMKQGGSISQKQMHFTDEIRLNKTAVGNLRVDCHHRHLVEAGESVQDLMIKLTSCEATLRGFKSLPPDVMLSRVELEHAKQKLAHLESRLNHLVQGEVDSINPE